MSENNGDIMIMPHDLNAEKAVVGAALKDSEIINEVAQIVKPAEFYNKQLAKIYETIVELNDNNEAIDLVTVTSALRDKGVPEEVTDFEFIKQIVSSVPITANAANYAQIIKNHAVRRQIIETGKKIANDAYQGKEDVDGLIDGVENQVMNLLSSRSMGDYVSIKDVVIDTLNTINKASQTSGNITGIASGFVDLDYKTSGFQKSDLILVAARPSMGKTAFVLNIAHYAAVRNNVSTAIFSLEMSKNSLATRILAQDSMVSSQKLRTVNLNPDEWGRLAASGDTVAKSKLIIDDTGSISIKELKTKCRKFKLEHNLGLVIIDYLQLMTGNSKEGRQNEIAGISRALKGLARELDVPIIALSQLSRAVESREDKRPMLSDLRESGAIEQDADLVMFIYRDDYYNKDTEKKNIAEIIIAKQRNGPVGTVELTWLPEYTKFGNKEHDNGYN